MHASAHDELNQLAQNSGGTPVAQGLKEAPRSYRYRCRCRPISRRSGSECLATQGKRNQSPGFRGRWLDESPLQGIACSAVQTASREAPLGALPEVRPAKSGRPGDRSPSVAKASCSNETLTSNRTPTRPVERPHHHSCSSTARKLRSRWTPMETVCPAMQNAMMPNPLWMCCDRPNNPALSPQETGPS